jgi:DNA-binding GntR family transcriptional regulator
LADDRQRDLGAEHRQLMDLILARDADGAVEALTYHIKRAPERLIAYAREHRLDDLNTPPPTESPRTQRRVRRPRRK